MCSLQPIKHVLNLRRIQGHIPWIHLVYFLGLQIFSKYVQRNFACLINLHIHFLQIQIQCDDTNQPRYYTAQKEQLQLHCIKHAAYQIL
jgi:hypothetical protein